MADVYLDGAKLDFEDTDNSATIGDLVGALENDLGGSMRCITELWIDHVRLDDWKDVAALKKPLSSCAEIRLVTGSVDQIAFEGASLIREYIKFIKNGISGSVRDLRLGLHGGSTDFVPIFEGLKEIVKTMDALTRTGGRSSSMFKENPAAYFNPLLSIIERLSSANADQDTILVADILEYDLSSLLVEMEDKIFHQLS